MRRFDRVVLASLSILVLASLATLYSISITSGEGLLNRQLIYFAIGGVLFVAASFFDYRSLSLRTRIIYLAGIIFLVLVLFFAPDVRGSNRWLRVFGFNFQPVEFFKIALILSLARFFALKRGEVKSSKVLFHSGMLAVLPVGLVMLQPDLGSAMVLVACWFGLLLLTPVKLKQIIALVFVFIALSLGGWYGFLHDYQKQRIATFLEPSADPQGSGYNVRQAIIAVGSGQMLGRGLGRGYQSHLRFLPERHTDFIFASFAEELGFAGSILLLATFGLLIWRLIRIGARSVDSLGMYICYGVALVIAFQVFINIGMNLGLAPVTGIPLPLVSYGGSSLLATMFLLGLTQSVYRRSQNSWSE